MATSLVARYHLTEYERLVAEKQLTGALTAQEIVILDSQTDGLRFTVNRGGDFCAGTVTYGPIPVLYDWAFTPEDARPTVTLVDAGSEPRQVRAYDLAPGAFLEASMRLTTFIEQEIDGVVATSTTTTVDNAFTVEIIDVLDEGFIMVSTTGDFRVRSSDSFAVGALESVYADLVGQSIAQLFAPTREILAVEQLAGLDLVGDLTTALAGAAPPLPTEAIGVGAVWTVRATVAALGITVESTSTYTLIDVDGPLLTVEVESMQQVDQEALDDLVGLQDAEVTLNQSGFGEAVWDLTAAVPPSASATTVQVFLITATFDGVEGTLDQTTTIKFEIPSPWALGPPEGTSTFEIADNTHFEGDIDYEQDPPVGGPHSPVWQTCGYYDSPIATGAAVHSLEHGAVWITYQPGLAAEEIEYLRTLAQSPYTLVSPYPGLDNPVVASAWGVQLRLDDPLDPRLANFVDWFAAGPQTPEPGAPCTGGVGEPR